MRSTRLRVLMEIALSVALAYVLRRFAVWQMPFGGDVSLAMLPIIVIALRRGIVPGMIAGALFGLLDYTIEPYFVHWAQIFLDYPIAYALVGLAGVARPLVRRASARPTGARVGLDAGAAVLGTVVGVTARFASHFVSGVIFFAANAPKGQPVWLYSVIYNGTYLLPSMVACAVGAALVVPVLEIAVPASVV
jgi:thiamine transporter